MIVQVEQCWSGGENFYFRLTIPCGSRESISGDKWNRKTAIEAKDMLAALYGADRAKIRFNHK